MYRHSASRECLKELYPPTQVAQEPIPKAVAINPANQGDNQRPKNDPQKRGLPRMPVLHPKEPPDTSTNNRSENKVHPEPEPVITAVVHILTIEANLLTPLCRRYRSRDTHQQTLSATAHDRRHGTVPFGNLLAHDPQTLPLQQPGIDR